MVDSFNTEVPWQRFFAPGRGLQPTTLLVIPIADIPRLARRPERQMLGACNGCETQNSLPSERYLVSGWGSRLDHRGETASIDYDEFVPAERPIVSAEAEA